MSPRIRLKVCTPATATTIAIALALLTATLVAIRFWPRPPLAAQIPSSVAILDDNGRLLRLTVAADQQYRLWTALDEVSPEFVAALLLHEDRHFHWHPGVNPAALARAAFATYTGSTRQGGSTVTMQLARLLYGLNTRSTIGKLQQIALAIGLELRYSKRDLLEAHINLIPYGSNVQGVGAASLIYFEKRPARLALNEALTLVLVPQAPTSRNPLGESEPPQLTHARLRLFAQWLAAHPDARDQSESMQIPLHYKSPRNLPFEAPHFTTALLAQGTRAGEAIIQTTLELHQQQTVERVLRAYVREQTRVGIRNSAALLVDTRTLATRAAVGSADFFDESIAGQVNGTLAKRSPGSALKPFVYALAIDQGLIHPLTVLKDAPTAFGTFSPENFDGRFVGPISATEALIRSRNVPAVALSSHLSQPSLYEFLRSAGISQLASERHYGLALALGGGEVTMEEAATLYAMIANHGLLRPLRHRSGEPLAPGTRLLSEEASFMVIDMLEQNPRPEDSDIPLSGRLPVAWKTGTSWGFRDAWTAGVFGHYVLVVWVGNFDGSSNPALIGAQAAAPLFFRIVDALHAAEPDIGDIWLRPPPGVIRVEVCAASGDLPNADCPQTATTWYIPGKSPIRLSDIHRRIWFDTRTGQQACPPYDPRFVRSEVFEFWPSDMLRLFAQAGMPRRQPPAVNVCRRGIAGGHAPSINSPLRNATYTLRAARVGSETIPLTATTDGAVRTLHWFVDNAYVGTARPDATVTWAPGRSGAFLVRAIDDQGRVDSRELRVAVIR
ncbi:MAG: penicillin-binding protein 1C [Steroidobacteraceae bacterium]